MKKTITGFIIGLVVGAVLASSTPIAQLAMAALPLFRNDREKAKFTTDTDGNVAIRAVVVTEAS
jgi:hypothetical protein